MNLSRRTERIISTSLIAVVGLGVYFIQENRYSTRLQDAFNRGRLTGWEESQDKILTGAHFAPYKVVPDTLETELQEI